MRRALLIYDGECGFCTSSVRFADRWIRPQVQAVPWQRADLASLDLNEAACEQAVQYRDAAGRWHAAGRAVAAMLSDSRYPWKALGLLARVPGIAWLIDRLYEVVANNRHRLPGGTPACKVG